MVKESKEHNLSVPFFGKRFFRSSIFHALLICLTGVVVYSNTLNAPFQWDEYHYLIANPIVKNLDYFLSPLRAARSEYYGGLIGRYVGYLSFALNYHFNGFNVLGYHIVNIVIHILNALFLYLLVILTFRTPLLAGSKIKGRAGEVALFTSLLFVSHPVQTEAVTYVFQRFASLAAFFYLVSIVMYVKGRLATGGIALADAGKPRGRPAVYFLLSFISAALAMETKENAFTLPVVIVLYDFFFFYGPIRKRILYTMPLLLTMAIIPLTLIGVDRPLGKMIGAAESAARGAKYISRSSYLFTQFRVILTYLRLLAFPINQDIVYSYPTFRSFFNYHVLLSSLVILSMTCAAAYMLFSSKHRTELRMVSFGLFFFLVALSVESSIIPIPMLIDEYRVYLPSAGIFLAVTVSIYYLAEGSIMKSSHKITVLFLAAVVIMFATAAYCRNETWGSRISLWQDVAAKSQDNAAPYENLGEAYYKENRLHEAIREYEIALRLNPDYSLGHSNLGAALSKEGLYMKAKEEFQTAIMLDSTNENAYHNLGKVWASLGRSDEAIRDFQAALRLDPSDAAAHNDLGEIYYKENRLDEAIGEFQAALKSDPDYALAHNNLGTALSAKGLLMRAKQEFQVAVKLAPRYEDAYYNLGQACLLMGQTFQAMKEFKAALRLNPKDMAALRNLELLRKKLERTRP